MIEQTSAWPDDGIILFDGVCVLCSGWVRFVAKRDVEARFRFTPIQSAYGSALARHLGIDPSDPHTNAVLIDGHVFTRSDAAIEILSRLPRWRLLRVATLMPRPLRDAAYVVIARSRYRVFGRRDVCDVGEPAYAERILVSAPAQKDERSL